MQRRKTGGISLWAFCALISISSFALAADQPKESVVSASSTERHLTNIRQLTFGRQNAEAYFSFNGTKLIFQSTNDWTKDSGRRAGSEDHGPVGAGALPHREDRRLLGAR